MIYRSGNILDEDLQLDFLNPGRKVGPLNNWAIFLTSSPDLTPKLFYKEPKVA